MNTNAPGRRDEWVAASGPDEGPLTGRWFLYALIGVPTILVLSVILTPAVSRGRPIARTMTLLSAAKQGDTAHVQSFLQSGAAGFGVNSHAGGGWTPLMIAAANGRVEVVELLLSHAADVTLRNADGETALSLARRHGYGEVERLLEAGGAKE